MEKPEKRGKVKRNEMVFRFSGRETKQEELPPWDDKKRTA